MKKSFTLIELVFVVVVIGILSAIILPSTRSDNLREAAIQLVSHIRYTQHLAMVDDKFNVNNNNGIKWYKQRWRFSFANGADTNNKWSYTVWSDTSGTGSPDPSEIAVNPLSKSKKLTGGANGTNLIHSGDINATKEMNLGNKFGIVDVKFSSPCRTGVSSKSIGFDHLGRPLRGAIENYTSSYDSAVVTNILVSSPCKITLVDDTGKELNVTIKPETGYTYIGE
ncbi:MAG: type II/IV secretion system protein [Campylobacterales bacterium]|nr:type II/IV secretion system protein [Campylobacterales bacterium]